MSEYPMQPAGSNYRRTGTLRRSWHFDVKSGGGKIEGAIKSQAAIAPYNVSVQGDEQREVFRNIGWHSTDDLSRRVEKTFMQRIQDMVDKNFR